MIEAFYENPNKPKSFVHKYVYSGAPTPPVSKQQAPSAGLTLMANGYPEPYNRHNAISKGVTPEEFVRRDVLVREEAKKCTLMHGDIAEYAGTGSPEDAKRHEGLKYRVFRVYRHYGEFDRPVGGWDDQEARWVVAAREVGNEGNLVLCSATFLKKVSN